MPGTAKTLCRDQVEQLKKYFQKMRELRGIEKSVEDDWSYEDLSGMTVIFGLIEKFGNGDPIKAAHKHREVIVGVQNAIRNSSSEKSTKIH